MTSKLTDVRIAEIEALWSNDRQTVMDHIPDLLAEVKALRVEKDNALAQNAVTMLDSVSTIINGMVNGVAGEDGQMHASFGIRCIYCGSLFDNAEEAKEHDCVCESHPAVIRAKKAEAERDVLAMRLAYDEDSPLACPERPCGMGWAPKEECFACWLKYAQQQADKEG